MVCLALHHAWLLFMFVYIQFTSGLRYISDIQWAESDCMKQAYLDLYQCAVRDNGIAWVSKALHYDIVFSYLLTAAMAQWVRAFAQQTERCVFVSKPRKT